MASMGFGVAIALLTASAAHAGYLGNRAGWEALNDDQKIAYAMAVYDTPNILYGDDTPETGAVKRGRVRCLAEEQLPPGKLVEWLDQAYADSPKDGPPSTKLIGAISRHCARQIEDEEARLKSGKP